MTQQAPAQPTKRAGRGLVSAPRVFWPAAVLLVVFAGVGTIWPGRMESVLTNLQTDLVTNLSWWFVALVTGFVAFSIWIALSPMGKVVLGKDDEEPEFGLGSWFAMLFAAGMGIGLVFYGVAEPLYHFAGPPPGTGGDEALQARTAFDVTYLHWGLHAWAIYVVVGLAMAYAIHRKGRPVSIRWALEPLIGTKWANSFVGDVIDVVAVVGTLFGVATSLGIGVTQIGAGFGYLGWVSEPTDTLLVGLIAVITGIALVSVVSGIDKGIKLLSNTNMVLAGALVLFVLVVGPTVFLLSDFVQQIGSYLQNFLRMSFNTFSFESGGSDWLSGWTTFYWGWWISWAPFVGVFIARISRGRTVRQFVTGVLLVPTTVTFLWFAILGGTAIHRELFGNGGLIGEEGAVSLDTALFEMLDGLPGSTVLSVMAILLIAIFFITSSDSGSFVVDMIASGGTPHPPVWSRAFWASMEGVIAAVLLLAGGLTALQTMAILVSIPFSVVMVLMVIATVKALNAEHRIEQRRHRKWLAEQVAEELSDNGSSAQPAKASRRVR
jgi:choline/glycine/proline betaine transport protein